MANSLSIYSHVRRCTQNQILQSDLFDLKKLEQNIHEVQRGGG